MNPFYLELCKRTMIPKKGMSMEGFVSAHLFDAKLCECYPDYMDRMDWLRVQFAGYSPDQERDDSGRWTDGGGSDSGTDKKSSGKQEKLLAPNGKPSKLNKVQYELVRSKEFKEWFGDWEKDPANASKVVDENGEPLVVYHGTKGGFDVFDLEKAGEASNVSSVGFWFGETEKFAKKWNDEVWYTRDKDGNSQVYSVFLLIKNPKVFESDPPEVMYGDSYEKFKTDIYKIDGMTAEDANIGGLGMVFNSPEKEVIKKYREHLKDQGYDGIIIKKTRFDRRLAGKLNNQYVALYPTQIKLADGSNKKFSKKEASIKLAGYDPDQERDDSGRWTSGGGSSRSGFDPYLNKTEDPLAGSTEWTTEDASDALVRVAEDRWGVKEVNYAENDRNPEGDADVIVGVGMALDDIETDKLDIEWGLNVGPVDWHNNDMGGMGDVETTTTGYYNPATKSVNAVSDWWEWNGEGEEVLRQQTIDSIEQIPEGARPARLDKYLEELKNGGISNITSYARNQKELAYISMAHEMGHNIDLNNKESRSDGYPFILYSVQKSKGYSEKQMQSQIEEWRGSAHKTSLYAVEGGLAEFVAETFAAYQYGHKIKQARPELSKRLLGNIPEELKIEYSKYSKFKYKKKSGQTTLELSNPYADLLPYKAAGYDPDQERDSSGKWTDGGGGSSSKASKARSEIMSKSKLSDKHLKVAKEALNDLPDSMIDITSEYLEGGIKTSRLDGSIHGRLNLSAQMIEINSVRMVSDPRDVNEYGTSFTLGSLDKDLSLDDLNYGTLSHELYHAMDYSPLARKDKAFLITREMAAAAGVKPSQYSQDAFWRSAVMDELNLTEWGRKNLSEYSGSDLQEFMAESYSAYQLSNRFKRNGNKEKAAEYMKKVHPKAKEIFDNL